MYSVVFFHLLSQSINTKRDKLVVHRGKNSLSTRHLVALDFAAIQDHDAASQYAFPVLAAWIYTHGFSYFCNRLGFMNVPVQTQ